MSGIEKRAGKDTALELYRTMSKIHTCEMRVRRGLSSGEVGFSYWPVEGHEAMSAGAAVALAPGRPGGHHLPRARRRGRERASHCGPYFAELHREGHRAVEGQGRRHGRQPAPSPGSCGRPASSVPDRRSPTGSRSRRALRGESARRAGELRRRCDEHRLRARGDEPRRALGPPRGVLLPEQLVGRVHPAGRVHAHGAARRPGGELRHAGCHRRRHRPDRGVRRGDRRRRTGRVRVAARPSSKASPTGFRATTSATRWTTCRPTSSRPRSAEARRSTPTARSWSTRASRPPSELDAVDAVLTDEVEAAFTLRGRECPRPTSPSSRSTSSAVSPPIRRARTARRRWRSPTVRPRPWVSCRPSTARSTVHWHATTVCCCSARTSPIPRAALFKVTTGLSTKHGTDRVRNTPIAESSIIGAAHRCVDGRHASGRRADVHGLPRGGAWTRSPTTRPRSATCRVGASTRRSSSAPTVGMSSGPQHSQALEAWAMHVPGIKVVWPSTSADAVGLLNACLDDDDPCLFVESMKLFFGGGQFPVPLADFSLPFGKADRKARGRRRDDRRATGRWCTTPSARPRRSPVTGPRSR